MQKLILHGSALTGLLVFLKQAWTYAPLDRALLTSIGTGLAIYLVLLMGSILIRRIAAYTPPEPERTEEPNSTEDAASQTDVPSHNEEPSTSNTNTSPPAEQEPTTEHVAAPMA